MDARQRGLVSCSRIHFGRGTKCIILLVFDTPSRTTVVQIPVFLFPLSSYLSSDTLMEALSSWKIFYLEKEAKKKKKKKRT